MKAALLREYGRPLELVERPAPEPARPDLRELLQLHSRGRVTLRTSTYRLARVNEALDALRAGEITGRAVLVPD